MNYKITFTLITFIQILFGINFKNKIAHLKSYRFHFWSNIFTRRLNMAESFITFTIKIRESSSPFLPNSFKNIGRNRKLWTSSINNSRIAWIFSRFLHSFITISHTLTFKSPSSKPIREIFESLKTIRTTNNLCWIVTTKQCVRSFLHFFGGYRETNHRMINYSIVLERPKIMQLLFRHVFVWWQS